MTLNSIYRSVCIAVLLAFAVIVNAQPREVLVAPKRTLSIGAYGMAVHNEHKTNANIFYSDSCGCFGNGTGSGAAIGIFLEMPVLPMLDVRAAVGYVGRGGNFGEARIADLPILDERTNQYVVLDRKHAFTVTLPQIVAELGVKFMPLENIPLYLGGGFYSSLPLEDATTYSQSEEILAPSGVVFPETHTTVRTVGSGPVVNLTTSFGASGILGYEVPLSHALTAAPEIRYYFPLSVTREEGDWKITTIQAGIALRWNMLDEVPPPPPPPPPPPVVKAEPMPPQPYIGLANNDTIKVVETTVTETFPLLPYIFFDSASATLSSRYDSNSSSNFRESELPHNSLGAYSHILNIVGSRLAHDPSATITITGTTDGREAAQSKQLALARAQTVKAFLTSKWNIDVSRIKTVSSITPTYPSSANEQAGIEENRRVEIASDNDNILRPIVHEKFKEFAISPRAMPFVASVRVFEPAKEWKFKVRAGDKELYSVNGMGEPPQSLNWKLDLAEAQKIASSIDRNADFKCELEVIDKNGVKGTTAMSLPVEKKIHPFELSRLSLVVFDFDKAEIGSENKKMVSTFVAKTIREGSEVGITGTTDAMGELEHNKSLSEDRAFAVHELIKKENPVAHVTEVKGIGPRTETEANATPEARYYCRTVTVQVQTPLEK